MVHLVDAHVAALTVVHGKRFVVQTELTESRVRMDFQLIFFIIFVSGSYFCHFCVDTLVLAWVTEHTDHVAPDKHDRIEEGEDD